MSRNARARQTAKRGKYAARTPPVGVHAGCWQRGERTSSRAKTQTNTSTPAPTGGVRIG